MFAFWLGDKEKGDESGEVVIGGYDEDRFTGNITWLPVRQEGFWEVDLNGVSVRDGSDQNMKWSPKFENTGAIIDTGTSHILAPRSAAIVSILNLSSKCIVVEQRNRSQERRSWTLDN
jgi:saccharopepsin